MALKRKSYFRTKECREKSRISALKRKEKFGWIIHPNTIEASRKSKLGKRLSIESIRKRVASRVGYRHSEETKRKISVANKGKKRKPLSKETRLKISESHKGEKSSLWKGGCSLLYPIKRVIRKLFKYRLWRSDVFKRDNYTCQICGARGEYLEAHHRFKRFIDIIKEYNIQTLDEAINCEELWDIDNGMTLCTKCHKCLTFLKK